MVTAEVLREALAAAQRECEAALSQFLAAEWDENLRESVLAELGNIAPPLDGGGQSPAFVRRHPSDTA